MLLTGATLIDGTGAEPRRDTAVEIEGSHIASVGRRTGSDVDLDGLTLLPGLIDAHTHLAAVAGIGTPIGVYSIAELAARLFRNCELALDAGFTTCREVGGVDGGVVRAIEQGLVRGPRIFPSGAAIAQDGGHGTMMPAFSDCFCPLAIPGLFQITAVCNSPDEVRLAVRRNFRRGATQIKVLVTGGVVSTSDELDETQLTVEEIRAAVVEAEARNTYVTVHSHNCRGVRNGLAAGVRCVEHGTNLDEETAELMAAAGCGLVPTLAVAHLMSAEYAKWGLPELVVPRVRGVEQGMADAALVARRFGITVGSGSDLLGPDQDRRGLELVLRSRLEDPLAAIRSATLDNARIMRRADHLGSVEPGKLADLIAVDGDPLAEPELFDDPGRVVLVIKDGLVCKDTQGRAARTAAQAAAP
jgi:imidazolonepropionase-like amidohydrolase